MKEGSSLSRLVEAFAEDGSEGGEDYGIPEETYHVHKVCFFLIRVPICVCTCLWVCGGDGGGLRWVWVWMYRRCECDHLYKCVYATDLHVCPSLSRGSCHDQAEDSL